MSERPILWTPRAQRVARSNLARYQRWLRETRGVATSGGDPPPPELRGLSTWSWGELT